MGHCHEEALDRQASCVLLPGRPPNDLLFPEIVALACSLSDYYQLLLPQPAQKRNCTPANRLSGRLFQSKKGLKSHTALDYEVELGRVIPNGVDELPLHVSPNLEVGQIQPTQVLNGLKQFESFDE